MEACRVGDEGWFVAPTVFDDVHQESDLARNEVFGPVQAVLRFHDDDDVLAKANDSAFGLGAYFHTRDPLRIRRFVDGLQAGTVSGQRLGRDVAGDAVRRIQAQRLRSRGRPGRH